MSMQLNFTVRQGEVWRSRQNPKTSRVMIKGVDPVTGKVYYTHVNMMDPVHAEDNGDLTDFLRAYEKVR